MEAIQADLPRSGRKSRSDAEQIGRVTTQTKPAGATLWSNQPATRLDTKYHMVPLACNTALALFGLL